MAAQDKIATAEALLAEAFAELNAELPRQSGRHRGAITQDCWRLRLMTGELRQYFSQSGQDWFIDQVLIKERRGGVFVDVGGYDGVTGSNTLFFEMFRAWTGLLIEPVADLLARACEVRRNPCIGAVVSGEASECDFLEVTAGFRQMSGRFETYDADLLKRLRAHPEHGELIRRVETRTLADILSEHRLSQVDYLSLDIEGGELDVLKTFPFEAVKVGIFSIENALGHPEIHALMTARGYRLVEFLGVDEIYCRADLLEVQAE